MTAQESRPTTGEAAPGVVLIDNPSLPHRTDIWWRHTWMEAVWCSDLPPMQKLVAAVYADHARDERTTWVTLDRLCQRTRLGRTQAKKWRVELVAAGWLVEVEKARQHRATIYALVIPEHARGSENRQSEQHARGSVPRPSGSPRGSESDAQGVGNPAPGGRFPDPNQRSIKVLTSSSSPAARHVATLLGRPEEDELVRATDDYLASRGVRHATAWLTRCHDNGDLERGLTEFVTQRSAEDAKEAEKQARTEAREHERQDYLTRLHEHVGPDEADRLLREEADAAGVDVGSLAAAKYAFIRAREAS